MSQFDVFRLPGTTDLLLDVQCRRLNHLVSRMAVPLVLRTPFLTPAPKLNPVFLIEDEIYVMMTHYMTSVPARELRQKATGLQHEQDNIKAALDMLFYDF